MATRTSAAGQDAKVAPLTVDSYSAYTTEYLRVGNLTRPVDFGEVPYQRNRGTNGKMPKMVRARYRKLGQFDASKLRHREVSRRADGTLACMDGNGSNHWVQDLFGPDSLVPCKVYEGLTLAQEAAKFIGFQKMKLVTKTEQFHAGNIAGEEAFLRLGRVAEKYGFTVSTSRQPGAIPPSALERMWDSHGETSLHRVLYFAYTHFADDPKQTNGSFLQGLARVLLNSDTDEARLVRAVEGTDVTALIDNRAGGAAVTAVAENLNLLYSQTP